jgi:hypothetical protein
MRVIDCFFVLSLPMEKGSKPNLRGLLLLALVEYSTFIRVRPRH